MTLPSTGSISMDQIAAELGLSLPLAIDDARVLALAGKTALPVSIPGDFYGRSNYIPMVGTGTGASVDGDTGSSNFTAWAYPSVFVSNGSGGYTYSWSFQGDSTGFSLQHSELSQCQVGHTIARFGTQAWATTMQCAISDDTGHQITVTGIPVSFHFTDPRDVP